jgi:hypothetical protein
VDGTGADVGAKLSLHCEHVPHADPPLVRFMSSKLK